MVAGVLEGSKTAGETGRDGRLVLASDAGLVASKLVVSDEPWKRVEVELVVLRSIPGWMDSESVVSGK